MTDIEALKLALEALEELTDTEQTHSALERGDLAIIALREALAQPTTGDYALGYAEGFNDACKKPAQPQQEQAYKQANPLGGPAKVFDAMANAIRAGDDYHAVLRQYGFAEQQEPVQQEPEIVERIKCRAGQTLRTVRNPNITARESIELANWIVANTAPPAAQRPWQGLSDEEALECWPGLVMYADCAKFWKNIEAKLKEKNDN